MNALIALLGISSCEALTLRASKLARDRAMWQQKAATATHPDDRTEYLGHADLLTKTLASVEKQIKEASCQS